MARAALDWGVRDLARHAGVSQTTVVRFEQGVTRANAATVAVIQKAFEDAGIEFTNGDAPGVRMRRQT